MDSCVTVLHRLLLRRQLEGRGGGRTCPGPPCCALGLPAWDFKVSTRSQSLGGEGAPIQPPARILQGRRFPGRPSSLEVCSGGFVPPIELETFLTMGPHSGVGAPGCGPPILRH